MNFKDLFSNFSKSEIKNDFKQKEDDQLLLKPLDHPRFRVDLLNSSERKKLTDLVKNGKIVDFSNSEDLIRRALGKESMKRMHWNSIDANRQKSFDAQIAKTATLRAEGREREPFLLDDAPIKLINIHGASGESSLESLKQSVPDSLKYDTVDVVYQENTSSNQNIDIDDRLGKPETLTMADASGKIDGHYLKNFFSDNPRSSFIMSGGNLRGCFLESLKGLISSAKQAEVKKLDVHIPLDKCYDDEVYDKLTPFPNLPAALSGLLAKENAEIYEDRRLSEATGSPDKLESQYRFYLWQEAETMKREMSSQQELAEVRKSIGTTEISD